MLVIVVCCVLCLLVVVWPCLLEVSFGVAACCCGFLFGGVVVAC